MKNYIISVFSASWAKNLKKVEAYIALEITAGPHLVENLVKVGLNGFRNIVCWKNGDLLLSNNPRVKRFWSGSVVGGEVREDNPD